MANGGTVLFQLDIDSPIAGVLVESLLDAARQHGVRLRWGAVRGGSMTLALDGEIGQSEIVDILALKCRAKLGHPSTETYPSPAAGVPAGSSFFSEG